MVYLESEIFLERFLTKPSYRMFINTVKRLYIISGSKAPALGIRMQNS